MDVGKVMDMDAGRVRIYLAILERALLNIRLMPDSEERARKCSLEAEHVHNIPEILLYERPEDEKYYWDTERTSYRNQRSRDVPLSFDELWEQLGALIESKE